jgi:serine phosphatase RsbU (regulator of sigma subunit)
MSIIGMTALNKIVSERKVFDPASVMEELDAEVRHLLCQDTEGGNDGMDAVILAINPKRRSMFYCAAMRPLYRVRNGEITEFKADKFPIGGTLYGEKNFSGSSVALEPGDMFYLSSDGFSDQFGGSESKKYMARNFTAFLEHIASLPAAEQLAALEAEFDSWKGSKPQTDDVTVIGIRV